MVGMNSTSRDKSESFPRVSRHPLSPGVSLVPVVLKSWPHDVANEGSKTAHTLRGVKPANCNQYVNNFLPHGASFTPGSPSANHCSQETYTREFWILGPCSEGDLDVDGFMIKKKRGESGDHR
jgi:hypothetical protein